MRFHTFTTLMQLFWCWRSKDHVYRMWKVKYGNIWPNQTIVSDQSELTILLCQPMIIYVCSEDDVNWVQWPSTFHILYTWSLWRSQLTGDTLSDQLVYQSILTSTVTCLTPIWTKLLRQLAGDKQQNPSQIHTYLQCCRRGQISRSMVMFNAGLFWEHEQMPRLPRLLISNTY